MIADYIFVYLILWPIILRPQVAKTRRQTIISSSSVLKREETERGLCVSKRGDTHTQQTDVIKGGWVNPSLNLHTNQVSNAATSSRAFEICSTF